MKKTLAIISAILFIAALVSCAQYYDSPCCNRPMVPMNHM